MQPDEQLGFHTLDEEPPGCFNVLDLVLEPVRMVSRRQALRGHRLFRGQDGFLAAIPETVAAEMSAFARRAAPNEWIGVVMLELCEDEEGRFVLVHGVVPDLGAVAKLASVRTTTDSEFRTRQLAEQLFPAAILGGWVHSHPHYGVFFSEMDRQTQRSWSEPYALGIVVDPWDAKELAVFRGASSELLEPMGRTQERTTSPASTTPCAAQSTSTSVRTEGRNLDATRCRRCRARRFLAKAERRPDAKPSRRDHGWPASSLVVVCVLAAGVIAVLTYTNRRIDVLEAAFVLAEVRSRENAAGSSRPEEEASAQSRTEAGSNSMACEDAVACLGPVLDHVSHAEE